jgi:hypothetical protein
MEAAKDKPASGIANENDPFSDQESQPKPCEKGSPIAVGRDTAQVSRLLRRVCDRGAALPCWGLPFVAFQDGEGVQVQFVLARR